MTRLWAGEPSKKILDDVAAQWDELTEKIGVYKQRAAYQGSGEQAERLSEMT